VRLLDVRDPDLVEELAIEILGFARPGDRVVVPSMPERQSTLGLAPAGP
jgi:hypothetical protein